MRGQRLVVLAASAALLAIFLLSEPPRLAARRAAFLAATASKPLADRQIAGSGAAFDRRFFAFLEAARRALPVGVEGVALETSRGAQDELERGIPDRLFQWSARSFSHPEYPLGLPFLYAGLAFLVRRWDDHAMALLFPLIQLRGRRGNRDRGMDRDGGSRGPRRGRSLFRAR